MSWEDKSLSSVIFAYIMVETHDFTLCGDSMVCLWGCCEFCSYRRLVIALRQPSVDYAQYLYDNLSEKCMAGIHNLGIVLHPATLRGQHAAVQFRCVVCSWIVDHMDFYDKWITGLVDRKNKWLLDHRVSGSQIYKWLLDCPK